jgi:hypothetical protein
MGSVKKISTGAWQTWWRDPQGNQRAKNFDRKADAEDHPIHVEHSLQAHTYVDAALGRQTFREYAEGWRAIQAQHRSGTVAQIRGHLPRHI